MPMSGPTLADSIRSTMGFPLPTSAQLTGWASAVISEIQTNAIVNNATVTGTCPSSGGPLSSGASSGGVISGLSGARLASAVAAAAGYPFTSTILTTYCQQIVAHIQTGLVNFASGNITGNCTNTTLSPGVLASGAGSNGQITGLNGSTLANSIHSAVGYPGLTSTKLVQFCDALVGHIMSNAAVSYTSGQVTGTCPAGGGPLTGSATSGQIA